MLNASGHRDRHTKDKSCFELIEEAVHLVRTAPGSALASYYIGALPFVLGLLYFWIDMARSPFANRHLAAAALGMAALFLWMKFWQAIFARNLRAVLMGAPPPPLNFSRCRRIFITQTALQSTGLFAAPLALVPILPWPWVYAFYQNVTALADGEPGEFGTVFKASARQSAFWPRQNVLFLLVMIGFGGFVFLNWTSVCFLLPGLVKMLFGVESMFTRDMFAMLNTTFFAGMFGLSYLSVDPLVKAAYTLRCFYGESRRSGEDLKAELRLFTPPACRGGVVLLILVAIACSGELALAGSDSEVRSAPPPASSVSSPELDRVIGQVIQQNKYAWRAPRERIVEPETKEDGFVLRFLRRAGDLIRRWLKAAFEWLGDWLRRLFGNPSSTTPNASGYGWMVWLQILLYALIAAAVLALGLLIYRAWAGRRRQREAIASEPIQPAPDLSDENIGPDQLPEDGWTKLARELLERGEFRLAVRAFYLASLAHLAGRNLISLAKFKSNRDYERELRRRGHAFPELLGLFGENVSVFDGVWYGLHEINRDLVSQFAANVERIKTGGAP
jgi:hypothetical protein